MSPVSSKNVESVFPLSPMQQGMLFHSLEDPESGLYVEQIRLVLDGLDAERFRRAWEAVVARQPALRTSIVGIGLSEPAQVVRREGVLPWDVRDWRELGADRREAELASFLEQDARRGFELTDPGLTRITLFRTGEHRYECVWTLHHIALDGWSGALVLGDVLDAYGQLARVQEPELPDRRPFRDYVLWLRRQDRDAARSYWREALGGFTEATPLGAGRSAASPTVARYAQAELRIRSERTEQLRAGAAACRVTQGTLLQGAWALWLAKFGGVRDVVFGTVVSGRPEELDGVERSIGMFVNTLPTRVRVPAARRAGEWLQELQRDEAERRGFSHSPLVDVQRCSELPAGEQLFQSLFVFENYEYDGERLQADGLEVELIAPFDRTGYPLLLLAIPGEQLTLRCTYDAERFESDRVERLLEEVSGLALALARGAEEPLGRLLEPDAAERELVTETWNNTRADFPEGTCLHELFRDQARRTPDATAVVHGEEELSYRELEQRANRLANVLRECGCGPDARVALCFGRSVDQVVAALAVLLAGGAYVPLDPSLPEQRRRRIAEDAAPVVLVVHAATRADGEAVAGSAQILCLDGDRERIAAAGDRTPDTGVGPQHLAYVLYTSGSSGRPKGVAMPHAPLVNMIRWQLGDSGCGAGDRTLQFAPFSFDVSCQELFATLASGGALVLVDEATRRDPEVLLRLLVDQRVARLFLPFVALQQLCEAAAAHDIVPDGLREVITAGEQLQVNESVVRFFERLPRCVLVNQYGPTECHVVSSETLSGDPSAWPALPPIGRPIANVRLYVLDGELGPVPAGVPGELCIAGAAVSRGYLGDDARTAESFVPDPFVPGGRMYRTGDLARHLPGGELAYLGRADTQVKLRGFRVELGEVEAALLDHPRVTQAVAVLREDRPGAARLVAYVVSENSEAELAAMLPDALAAKLPEYMLPAAYVRMDELPLTASGKIDRRALLGAEHAPNQVHAGYVPPRSPDEAALAELWAEVLGTSRVGVHDDFFELGGHSLTATRLVSRIRDALSVELGVRALFEHPTIAGLAGELRAQATGTGPGEPPLVSGERSAEPPLSFAQARLWFLDQMGVGAAYNMPWAFELEGPLDVVALERALTELARRHETLRTRFPARDGQPVQQVVPLEELDLRIPLHDLSSHAPDERERRAAVLARKEAESPFDLANGPVFRPSLVELGDDRHLLFLSIHHIAFDGWSIGVANRELAVLYEAFSRGEPSPLPEPELQYADYARWQSAWLSGERIGSQLAYWQEHLSDLPLLRLPTDRPRPAVQSFLGASVPLELTAEQVRALRALSRREGVTLAMTLLAVYQVLLARVGDQTDVVVGSPIAGRRRSELEGLIGFFVNSIVLRGDLSGDPTFRELLARTKRTALAAYEHQDLPFERLVDELSPERDTSRNPIFQVVFALQNTPHEPLRLPGLEVRSYTAETQQTRFDLELHLAPTADVSESGGLVGGFVYQRDLFEPATMGRLAQRFLRLCEAVAASPELRLSELPLLLEGEREALIASDAARTFPVEGCLHELFEAQVRRTPDARAATCEGKSITYGELNERANRLARLLRSEGVGPETLVGLCVERGLDLVVAVLGILKAGGGYVPLDLANPSERIAFLLADSGVELVVTDSESAQRLPASSARPLCLDEMQEQLHAQPPENPEPSAAPENVAYVIYTSGSTGTPKGVLVEHASAVRLFSATERWFRFGSREVWTLFHSIAFDFSVWEMWGALLHGGRLVVVPYWVSREPEEFHELCVQEGVTVLSQTPSAFRQFSEADSHHGGAPGLGLRYVVFGGEALELQSLRPWFERHGDMRPKLVNMYGITETTVHVTYRPLALDDLERAPGSVIGVPIPDLRVYVLDARGEPCPAGTPGELFVGGAGVARGYLNQPELTAERFLPDSFATEPGARMYRTGDVARLLPSGDLEYLGRNDEQVKLRGFRIELGEIEAALASLPHVAEAVVTLRGEADERKLVAYVVPEGSGKGSEEAGVVGEWTELYDDTYSETTDLADPTFNSVGWNSSYTSEPIPSGEMREWVESTVARILRGRPRRVLELGCGTGLLLFRVAPHVERYVGIDLSQVALDHVARHLPQEQRERVELVRGTADDLSGLGDERFDTVVVNSVIQYFPSVGYLEQVIATALEHVAPGGRIVLGDVRNERLLEEFWRAVETFRAGAGAAREELERSVRQHVAQEEELLVAPEWFRALPRRMPRITQVEVELKRGRARNELTQFRYEVTLYVERPGRPPAPPTSVDWAELERGSDSLAKLLAEDRCERLHVRGIPNARLLPSGEPTGVEPDDLVDLVQGAGFCVRATWSEAGPAGAFDLLLWRGDESEPPPFPASRQGSAPASARANQPLQARLTRRLAPHLRDALSERLPDYMVPAAYVMLEVLPLTANGKVDRRALPEPEWFVTQRKGAVAEPANETQRVIADIWSELLGIEQVGPDDDFFDLGGHSLLATRVLSRLRDAFQVELPLRQLFEAPTVSELAGIVDDLGWMRSGEAAPGGGVDRETGEL